MGASYVVVDTRPWIFGKQVVPPAAMIKRIDFDSRTVYLDRAKQEIKNAPELDESTSRHDEDTARSCGPIYDRERNTAAL